MSNKIKVIGITEVTDNAGGYTNTDDVLDTVYGLVTDEMYEVLNGKASVLQVVTMRNLPFADWLKNLSKIRFEIDDDYNLYPSSAKKKGSRLHFDCARNE